MFELIGHAFKWLKRFLKRLGPSVIDEFIEPAVDIVVAVVHVVQSKFTLSLDEELRKELEHKRLDWEHLFGEEAANKQAGHLVKQSKAKLAEAVDKLGLVQSKKAKTEDGKIKSALEFIPTLPEPVQEAVYHKLASTIARSISRNKMGGCEADTLVQVCYAARKKEGSA